VHNAALGLRRSTPSPNRVREGFQKIRIKDSANPRSLSLLRSHPLARDLLERYPEVHDGYDRLGIVYEARGQNKQAADCYRKVIEFAREHPEQYDPEFEKAFQGWVEELDPPATT
jgi:hypothetical protein